MAPIVPLLILAVGAFALFGGKRKPKGGEELPDVEPTPAPPPTGGYGALSPIESRPGFGMAKAYYDRAMSPEVTNLAEVLATAEWLRVQGFPEYWESLAAKAKKLAEAAGAPPPAMTPPTAAPPAPGPMPTIEVTPAKPSESPVPAPSPPPAPAEVPPVAAAEVDTEADPAGTVALARAMIARESGTGWKQDLQHEISVWQDGLGLTPDGKFGIDSAIVMAQEVGTLPRVRFFPASTYSRDQAVKLFRSKLLEFANGMANPVHRTALEVSADAERGEAWGTSNPAPIPSEQRRIQQATLDQLLDRIAAADAS